MSPYYNGVLEMEMLLRVEQYQLDKLQAAIDRQAYNQFVMTADEDGISAWETMVGIKNGNEEPLDSRRFDVLARLLPPQPMTIKYLIEILKFLNINATIAKTGEFQYYVNFTSTDPGAPGRLDALLKQLMPANIEFNLTNRVTNNQSGELYVGMGGHKEVYRTNK